ncbi:hypothetical protein EJB05_00910, partial [Eragrostis curvula]
MYICDEKLQIIESEILTCLMGSKKLNSTHGVFFVMFESIVPVHLTSSPRHMMYYTITREKLANKGVKLALDEAKEALCIYVKQILLDPTNIPILKCYEDIEEEAIFPLGFLHNSLVFAGIRRNYQTQK